MWYPHKRCRETGRVFGHLDPEGATPQHEILHCGGDHEAARHVGVRSLHPCLVRDVTAAVLVAVPFEHIRAKVKAGDGRGDEADAA